LPALSKDALLCEPEPVKNGQGIMAQFANPEPRGSTPPLSVQLFSLFRRGLSFSGHRVFFSIVIPAAKGHSDQPSVRPPASADTSPLELLPNCRHAQIAS
jgi:hypothetical protein